VLTIISSSHLIIDENEVPLAFDRVDQFDFVEGEWLSFAGIIEIDIPIDMLHLLEDGSIKVKWETLQVNPNSQSRDAYAIDYSELEITVKSSSL